jgi:hypothetical protein
MSLGSKTLGFFGTLGDALWSDPTPGVPTQQSLTPLGQFPIAIDGRLFPIDLSFEPYRRVAYKWTSLPPQREAVTYDNIPGEGAVNIEGLWQRGQIDWKMGAGEQYLDIERDSQSSRFFESKGIDPFTYPYQATILPDTVQQYASANTNLKVVRCGTGVYIADGASLYYVSAWGATPVVCTYFTGGGVTQINDICSNDAAVYIATNNYIYYCLAGTTSLIEYAAADVDGAPYGGYSMVKWCNDQVIAASANRLYGFPFNWVIGTAPDPSGIGAGACVLMTHSNPNWVWSDAVGGETQTYISGYVSQNGANFSGCVYRSSLNTTAANNSIPWTLNFPVQALPMSPDEYPTCLASYLNFIFVGTNNGIRMCQTLSIYDPTANATGDLKAGPFIPNLLQPVSQPVTAIVGDGRFVWFAWSNYDSTSTGLGKLDLTTFIAGDPLAPAYCSDLMVTGQGTVTSLAWDPNLRQVMFAVAGMGVYTPDVLANGTVNNYVDQATLMSSIFMYGIKDEKIPVFFDYGVEIEAGTCGAQLVTNPLNPELTQTYTIPAVSATSNAQVQVPENIRAEQFRTILTLSAGVNGSGQRAYSPTLYRWTVEAWPAISTSASYEISLIVRNFRNNTQNGQKFVSNPYEVFSWFDNLRFNQTIVTFQEGQMSANVIVYTIEPIPHKEAGVVGYGLEGDIVVTLRTIGRLTFTPLATQ